jgi:hypothetical protein
MCKYVKSIFVADALAFIINAEKEIPLKVGKSFGSFQHVYKDIKSFVSLGAKNYCVIHGEENTSTIKVSGLTLCTSKTEGVITPETFQQCLQGIQSPILVPQVRAASTPLHETKRRKQNIAFSSTLHLKRKLTKNSFFTVPFGFN